VARHGAPLLLGIGADGHYAAAPLTQHRNRISAGKALRCALHRLEEAGARIQRCPDEVGDHLGVGIRSEGIALAHEFLFELGVVLDDAVMDDGKPT
jgi:hypothetical protein